jgi:hypothetical protein
MANKSTPLNPTRRSVLTGMAAGGALLTTGLGARFAQAQSSEPIRIGFQLHRTGIGASYGRWYERTATAALNDPFGRGWQLLGLPDHWVSFGFLTTHSGVQMIWMAQFAVILGAHLLAVVLNLKLTERLPEADGVRAHLPMTLLMIAYTVFGLWLLSSPTAG